MYKGRRIRTDLFAVLTVVSVCVTAYDHKGLTARMAQQDPGKLLKEMLESSGDAEIELKKDVVIHGMIHVRGKKRLTGRGHCIYRSSRTDRFYGGTVFCVEGGEFQISDTVISGIGGKKSKRRTYGRLIEVKKGKFVLGNKGVLKENCNTTWGEEGGGAVLVRKNAHFLMKGGMICRNETVTEGAAVKVEKGGIFVMKGGVIADNCSRGIGVIEGFDGRGGAIFNEGIVRIKKGQLRNNQAKAYRHGQDVYGGAGGAVYNRGNLLISGGTIYDSRGACGGAIYNDKKASLRITGGRFADNQADRGRTIFLRGGSCYLDVPMNLSKEIVKERACQFVRGSHVPGSEPEGKDKKPSDLQEDRKQVRIRWSGCGKKRIYYEREFIGRQEILSGVCAYVGDKNVTDRIRIREFEEGRKYSSKERERRIDTGRCKSGVLHLYVEGMDGTTQGEKRSSDCIFTYQIKKNVRPKIRTAPRYFFCWEVRKKSEKRLKQLLREGLYMLDDRENADELWETAEIVWAGMDSGREGTYRVSLTVTDQRGHRFYMKDGKVSRYGEGRTCHVNIPVTLVNASDGTDDSSRGKIRFLKRESGQSTEEWIFDKESIRQIKSFMHKQEENLADPFSEKTNKEFLTRFGNNRKIIRSG